MRRSRLISFVGALGASGVLTAVTLAASSYSVNIKLPADTIAPGHHFKVHAPGVSPSRTRLTVFLSAKSCAPSSRAEASRSATRILNKSVAQTYTSSKNATASQTTGTYYACAYLTAGSHTRAHAAKKYFVLVGGY